MYDDDDAARRSGIDKGRRNTEEAERPKAREEEAADPRADRARQHPVRIAILATLAKHGKAKGLTLCQMHKLLPEDRPLATVAYHLQVLLGANLVKAGDEEAWALP